MIILMVWAPQPGPQLKAATCPADFTFFGGSRGGGKSDCSIGRHLRGAELYQGHWNGLVVRRKYKEFNEFRRRIDELIGLGLPAERIGGDQQINHIRFKNGAGFILASIRRLDEANDWVGHQFTEITIEEATTFPFFSRMVDKLRGSLRSPHGVPTHMFGTGNPGGPGHNDVKVFFKLGAGGLPPETVFLNDIGEIEGKALQESRIFIPSFLKDNLILWENDPKYVAQLLSISDPALRKAWLEGDWDVFIGQAFGFSRDRHVIKGVGVPEFVPIYMTFDWGFGKPFSIGWWWVDNDNRIYRFAEWYGWNKVPDEGLRLEDSRIAEGVIEREKKMGIAGRNKTIQRLCDPTCFNKKPDYRGGGQGPSTAEIFENVGKANDYNLSLRPGDPSRQLKIRQFRERLKVPENQFEMPMMVVYENCSHFIRTIPALALDDDNIEDIDTEQEDHVYDEAAHICMARPLGIDPEKVIEIITEEVKQQKRAQLTPAHQKVWKELDDLRRSIEEMDEGHYPGRVN